MDSKMRVNKDQVFLVSGQYIERVSGKQRVSHAIKQVIVVAKSDVDAYRLLSVNDPLFVPCGHATLESFEKAANSIRDALNGKNVMNLKIVVDSEFNH